MIRVLHVDDEPSFLELVKFFLQREGDFEIVTSETAKDAIERLKEQRFDAVVADYVLPEINGIELLKILRAQGNDIPFILMTGRGRDEVASEALKNGADFYLPKGTDPSLQFATLAHVIRQMVRRRRSETDSKVAERFLVEIFSSIQDGIMVMDKDFTILRVNAVMERWYPHAAPLVGKKCFEACFSQDSPCSVCPGRVTLRSGKTSSEVIPKLGPKGEVTGWLDLFSFPMMDSNSGELTGVIEYARDITDRRNAENRLKEALDRYEELEATIDKSPVVLFLWSSDPRGKPTFVSRSISQFGYGREDFESGSVSLSGLVHRDDLKRVSAEIGEYLKKGDGELRQEYRLITKSGEVRWAMVRTYSRKGPDEGPSHYESILIDITPRKLALERLEEMNSRLQACVEAFPDLHFIVKSDGTILEYKAAHDEDLYTSPSQFLGKRMQDVLPPNVAGIFDSIFAESMKDGTAKAREYALDMEGKRRYFETRVVPMSNDKLMVVVRNISIRKEAELASVASESRYKQLADGITDVFFAFDKNLRYTYWNKASEELTGLKAEAAIGKSIDEIFHDPSAALAKETYLEALRTRKAMRATSVYKMDGEERVFELNVYPTEDGLAVIAEDVTVRMRFEDALKASEEKYRQLVELAQEGIWMIDSEAKTTYVNPRLLEMLGYRVDEVMGRAPWEFVVEEKREFTRSDVRERIGGRMGAQEVEFLTKDGRLIYSTLRAAPILGNHGEIRGALAVVTDISERKKAELELEKVNEKLNLLGHVTRHDTLNQLAVLMGWVGILEETVVEPPASEHLAAIHKAALAIQKELEFTSDYESVGVEKPLWIDVDIACRQGLSTVDTASIEVKIDMKGVEVLSDPMLDKVFHNLADNSVRHGKKVTKIRVHYEESPQGLTIIYEDDGVGIATQTKESVFMRGKGKHTGYGLYLIKGILGITHIDVKETGSPGRGARFEISIAPGNYRIAPSADRSPKKPSRQS